MVCVYMEFIMRPTFCRMPSVFEYMFDIMRFDVMPYFMSSKYGKMIWKIQSNLLIILRDKMVYKEVFFKN